MTITRTTCTRRFETHLSGAGGAALPEGGGKSDERWKGFYGEKCPVGGKKGSFIFVLSIYVRFCPVLFDFVRFLACIKSGGVNL